PSCASRSSACANGFTPRAPDARGIVVPSPGLAVLGTRFAQAFTKAGHLAGRCPAFVCPIGSVGHPTHAEHTRVLLQCILHMEIPVIPFMSAGVLGVVMLVAHRVKRRVEGTVLVDEVVVHTAIK